MLRSNKPYYTDAVAFDALADCNASLVGSAYFDRSRNGIRFDVRTNQGAEGFAIVDIEHFEKGGEWEPVVTRTLHALVETLDACCGRMCPGCAAGRRASFQDVQPPSGWCSSCEATVYGAGACPDCGVAL